MCLTFKTLNVNNMKIKVLTFSISAILTFPPTKNFFFVRNGMNGFLRVFCVTKIASMYVTRQDTESVSKFLFLCRNNCVVIIKS